jgi:hypothetical protein
VHFSSQSPGVREQLRGIWLSCADQAALELKRAPKGPRPLPTVSLPSWAFCSVQWAPLLGDVRLNFVACPREAKLSGGLSEVALER